MTLRSPYVGTQVPGDRLTAANFSKLPGGIVGYTAATANQTGITTVTDLTNLSLSVPLVSGRLYKWTFKGEVAATADGTFLFALTDTSGTVLQRAVGHNAFTDSQTVGLVFYEIGGGTTPVRKMRLTKVGGTGSAGLGADATYPAFLMCEDLGPAT